MIKLINQLTSQLQTIKTNLLEEKDSFKQSDLNYQLEVLQEKIEYFTELFFSNYDEKSIVEIAKGSLSNEKITTAETTANKFNLSTLKLIVNQGYKMKEVHEKELSDLLKKHPDAEKKENEGSYDYNRAKSIRKAIENDDKFIMENRKKIKNFYNFLSIEDKVALVDNIQKTLNEGKETNDQLIEKANLFQPTTSLYLNNTYPVSKRFEELTSDKETPLAKYLLENEQDIKRLTVVSNSDATTKYYTKKVIPIETIISEKRYKDFANYAKEKGIDDIVNSTGQFDGAKIYFNKDHYQRYQNCIKEIVTSKETKANFKEVLKALDSFAIVDDKSSAGESANKQYGFTHYLAARKQFVDAINKNPANEQEIKEKLENLKVEEEKITKMYELIQEKLGDDYETMPINVDSFRNAYVPAKFRENLCINAKFNSLCIMLSFIKENKLDIDEFVDKPVEISSKCLQDHFDKNNIESVLKGKSKLEAILYLSDISKQPKLIDPIAFTRSFEMLEKSETDPNIRNENILSVVAVRSRNGGLNRALGVGMEYFNNKTSETLQNVFMAKADSTGTIPYFDCFEANLKVPEDMKTGLALDEKATIIEKIKVDDNIEQTFDNAIKLLQDFATEKTNLEKDSFNSITADDLFKAVQEFAVKALFACDLNGNANDQKRGYSREFVRKVFNVIEDYKEIEELKDFNFPSGKDRNRTIAIVGIINNKEKSIKTIEKQMIENQSQKEDAFIKEFERINKEIDELDAQADKISENLEKGATNQQIEEIALQQQQKFNEIKKLQNARIKELKKDAEQGMVTKYYFEKRCEQIKLLDNIKEKPAMFIADDKNYKNFNAFAKEVLQVNTKELTKGDIRAKKEQYNVITQQLKDEKRMFLLNKLLANNAISVNKSFNYQSVEEIVINDNFEEMKNNSKTLIENQQEKNDRVQIQVNLEEKLVDNQFDNKIEEDNKSLNKENVIK